MTLWSPLAPSPASRALLALPSLLYRCAAVSRDRLFDAGVFSSETLPVPVLSVGNITVGGTGKTPLVLEIATFLSRQGCRVAVLTRGYGRSSSEPTLVLANGSCDDPRLAGDEPVLLSRRLPDVPIVVDADRRAGGRHAVRMLGAEVLLLDDGFQHRWVRRDLDIVVLDATDPFGHYRLLPSGRLREPLSALRRAGLFVVTRSHPDDRLLTLQEVIRQYNPHAALFRAFHRPVSWVSLGRDSERDGRTELPPGALAGQRAAAFCAIGNPGSFRSDLESLGIELVLFESFRDHHDYTLGEMTDMLRRAIAAGASCVVTTEKDAVRLERLAFPSAGAGMPLFALRIRCELERPAEFFARIMDAAASPRGRAAVSGRPATGLPSDATGGKDEGGKVVEPEEWK